MRTASCILAALALLGLPSTTPAQTMPRKGDWVRLSTTTEPGRYYEGKLLREPGDSLVIRYEDLGPRTLLVSGTLAVPRSEVASLAVRIRKGSRLLEGTLIGAGSGLVLAVVANGGEEDMGDVEPGIVALTGGLTGGLIGALLPKHEWRTVALHELPAAPLVSWAAGEALVGVRLRF